MGCRLYDVVVDRIRVACGMTLEHACIFLKALFNEYYNDESMNVTIVRHEEGVTKCE